MKKISVRSFAFQTMHNRQIYVNPKDSGWLAIAWTIETEWYFVNPFTYSRPSVLIVFLQLKNRLFTVISSVLTVHYAVWIMPWNYFQVISNEWWDFAFENAWISTNDIFLISMRVVNLGNHCNDTFKSS